MKQIREMFQKFWIYIVWLIRLWNPFGRKAFLFAVATHNNIGDIAIGIAENYFLKSCGYKKIVNITIAECWDYYHCIATLLSKNATVFFHGGGNMGNIYEDEVLRRKLISEFHGRKMVVFPQSIFYENTAEGNLEKELSITYYNNHMISIFAREEKSYMLMKQLYPQAKVYLVPDIVLSMNKFQPLYSREGIAICFRNDKERLLSQTDIKRIRGIVSKYGTIHMTSMIYKSGIPVHKWSEVYTEKLSEFAKWRLLVTDRLHGMIFAALTQTPCIVFGNNHHKVSGVYQWIKKLNYIVFVESIDEMEIAMAQLLQMKNGEFTFDDCDFEELRQACKI